MVHTVKWDNSESAKRPPKSKQINSDSLGLTLLGDLSPRNGRRRQFRGVSTASLEQHEPHTKLTPGEGNKKKKLSSKGGAW